MRPFRLVFCFLLLLGSAFHAFSQEGVSWILEIEKRFYDFHTKVIVSRAPDLRLKSRLVAIDGETLFSYGFPLKREDYANAVKQLSEGGADAIALDVIFGQSQDVDGTQKLSNELAKSGNIVLPAIRSSSWLPGLFAWGPILDQQILQVSGRGVAQGTFVVQSSGQALDGAWEPILSAAERIALTGSQMDSDGNLRWYELVHAFGQEYFPSMALAAYAVKHQVNPVVELDAKKKIKAIRFHSKIENELVSSLRLTTDPLGEGRVLLRPLGRTGQLPDISFASLFKMSPSELKAEFSGRPVLIAATVDGGRAIQPTPADPLQAASHNHQSALEMLLNGSYLERHAYPRALEVFLALVSILIFLRLSACRLPIRLAIGGLWFFVIGMLGFLAFKEGIWIHTSPALLVLLAVSGLSIVENFQASERKRAWLRRAFESYLHPTLVNQIADNPDALKLGGERREIVILFCDLRDFTSFSENLTPEDLVTLMNQYLGEISGVVTDCGGTVDKFTGDGLMALWGAPVEDAKSCLRSLECADLMQKRFAEVQAAWRNFIPEQKVDFQIGIGIHFGEAVVGNMGSASRFNYTAMGDSVNLAARIEGLTKYYGVSLLVSESVAKKSHRELMALDSVKVKGRNQAVRIYTTPPDSMVLVAGFKSAYSKYQEGEFQGAKAEFEKLFNEFSYFRPLSVFIERLEDLISSPPEHWDGSFSMDEK
jgi:adenylate cyclase